MKLWALRGFTLLLSASAFVQILPSASAQTVPVKTTANVPATTNSETPAPVPAETTANVPTTTNSETPTDVTDPANSITSPDVPVVTTDSGTVAPDVYCAGKEDFDPCASPEGAGCKENSKCSCKKEEHFCRCNNDKDKWYIGENCDHEWTILTFALVASLPGAALATIVGVAVHCAHRGKKKGRSATAKSSKAQQVDPHPSSSKKGSGPTDDFSNLVFASDLQNGQRPTRLPQESVAMAPHPYSAYRNLYENPYASSQPSRNPYSSQDRYDGYKNPTDSLGLQNGTAGGNQSGYRQAGPARPQYSSPDYSSSGMQFPRVQTGRQY